MLISGNLPLIFIFNHLWYESYVFNSYAFWCKQTGYNLIDILDIQAFFYVLFLSSFFPLGEITFLCVYFSFACIYEFLKAMNCQRGIDLLSSLGKNAFNILKDLCNRLCSINLRKKKKKMKAVSGCETYACAVRSM